MAKSCLNMLLFYNFLTLEHLIKEKFPYLNLVQF